MSGFTPGPWQSKHDYTVDGVTTIIANVDGEIHPDGQQTYSYEFICTCEDEYGERSPRSQANARLIRCAPELYEALATICKGAVSHYADCQINQEIDAVCSCGAEEEWEAGKAALAKARGEQA